MTQLMGYLCGGPQVYTGVSMADSHKHLNISEEEWGSFIENLHDVCDELGLPQQEVADVTAVIESMRADCIIQDGEHPPDNPGHKVPPGDSLYARCGGVYPLALVCDRLVDALLSDATVKIQVDGERTMASLKYLFTELVCALAGGPETMTAASIAATRLNVSAQDFFKLLGSVTTSGDHLEPPTLAAEIAQKLYDAQDLLLKAPLDWNMQIALEVDHHKQTMPHHAMKLMIETIAKQVNTPLLYVPSGKAGLVLALEVGVPDSAKAQRRQMTTKLGFEEMDNGVCMTTPPTDKDVMLLIDTSGSMQGKRIQSATDNALKIYDNFTTPGDDKIGLIHFHQKMMIRMKLQTVDTKNTQQRKTIDKTRTPEWGGTAFYDALIQAMAIPTESSNSYMVALTDGSDMDSRNNIDVTKAAIAKSGWTLFVIGLQVNARVRERCEDLANASPNGQYMHANDAGAGLDEAFAAVAAQFAMPKVKSADAAASGGGARGV